MLLNCKFSKSKLDVISDSSSSSQSIYFFHGGPGLSAKYWEPFAKEFALEADAKVYNQSLPNHDLNETVPSYSNDQLTADFVETLEKNLQLGQENILVFHSFSSALIINCLRLGKLDSILDRIQQIILTSTQFTSETAIEFKQKEKELIKGQSFDFKKNKEFIEYWKKTLPLYFYNQETHQTEDLMCENITWAENASSQDSMVDVCESLKDVIESKSKIQFSYICGDSDLIVPDGNNSSFKPFFTKENFVILDTCGHFPMWEKRLLFKEVLFDLGKIQRFKMA